MLCDKCKKNEATVSIRTNINGVTKQQKLCRDCAQEEGVFESAFDTLPIPNYVGQSAFSLPFSLAKVFGQLDPGQMTKTISFDVCPDCGRSIANFQEDGLFGCPTCYSHFRNWIEPMLDEIQGGHIQLEVVGGDGSRGIDLDTSISAEESGKSEPLENSPLSTLQVKLKDLVQQEKYEEAALVRDQIKAIKGDEQARDGGIKPNGQAQDEGE